MVTAMTIKVLTYKSLQPGPSLLLLGAVHGNEKCGTRALESLVTLLNDGTLKLAKGSLTIIPICNPKAYAQDVRFVERNLNRRLYPKPEPKDYEDFLDPLLCPHLGEADYLLDLHSYASPGGPFAFLGGKDAKETEFARALGAKFYVFGWQNAYQNVKKQPAEEKPDQHLESMGTTEYARDKGAKAITLECGHHYNADAPRVGLIAALRAMTTLGLLETADLPAEIAGFSPEDEAPIPVKTLLSEAVNTSEQVCIQMCQVYYKTLPGTFEKPWQHLDPVKKGDTLATFEDGSTLTADRDGYVILPKESSAVGGEWFYLGEPSGFPPESE